MILLSVIIPFFNTFSRSEKVLKRIEESLKQYSDVEFVLVDDGSEDDTLKQLKQYFSINEHSSLLKIIAQENKGPGGARNTGIDISTGKYIWVVDSDDDFYIDNVYPDLQMDNDFDFIDYNYIEHGKNTNSMMLEDGNYYANKVDLYKNLGRVVTKVFKREFFVRNNIKYPEYCIYEDNYFIYMLPYFIKKFKKTTKLAYFYEDGVPSVTRTSGLSNRFYDRLLTSYDGLDFLVENNAWKGNVEAHRRFREIFLFNTVKTVLKNFDMKKIKILFFIFCTYNFLEEKFDISKNGVIVNKYNRVINIFKNIFPKKNYLSFFQEVNKKAWKINE
ncbi:glycosyltransferase family 2 protein [Acinetobacter baumannii]|nr:glycosyltransferase family 2 protein [Acinetobacter baumannii]